MGEASRRGSLSERGGFLKIRMMTTLVVLGTLLGTAAPALADEAGGGGKNKMPGMSFRWKATSPAIHEGDRYTLLVTNTSEEAQEARIRTVIMDHANHTNTDVVDEQVELAPGEEREFTTDNDYGTANHFNTIIGSKTQDLALAVNIVDSGGAETARFNEKAFLVQEAKAKGNDAAKADKHSHNDGFTASVPAALWDTVRLSPFSLGVLAVAGFGLYTVRRRMWSGPANSGLAESFASPPLWKTAAAGGLVLSAALHVGLAPAHFGEAAAQGIFFYSVGMVEATIAAAILVWPSRLTYLAGAGISFALIALWTVFLLIPPPGSETAEAVDLVGLVTKATELLATIACIVLWFRARRIRSSDRTEI